MLYNPLNHSVVQAYMKADGWQKYECPDYVEALLFAIKNELERVYWNWHQERLEDREDWQFLELEGFQYRRYFWGECDCGAESPVHSTECRIKKEHDGWIRRRLDETCEQVEGQFYSNIRFDRFEEWEKNNPYPPCTCGAEESWKERDHHLETCSPQLPNLVFENVMVSWYKHMGRGMSINVDWTEKQWREWFDRCLKKLGIYDTCHKFHSEERIQIRNCPECNKEIA
jgi:hypothetical protein